MEVETGRMKRDVSSEILKDTAPVIEGIKVKSYSLLE